MNKFENLLKAQLNVNWIRPESALCDAIISAAISENKIVSPSLDLGCGNGIFSFITAGGEFSLDYDWYINVSDTEGFWDNEDIYNAYKKGGKNHIIKSPLYSFTVGLDHKKNLLQQAEELNLYEKTIEHDANNSLPFEKGSFKTIFSNILYWLDDPKDVLAEIYRILAPGGKVILCLPNTKFFEYCISYQWQEKNSELLRLLNRGRSEDMHFVFSYEQFEKLATEVGFEVKKHSTHYSPLTLKIWDIGLRPFSPHLINMANALSANDRRKIKKEWIKTAFSFLSPLFDMDSNSQDEGGFHLFVLKK